MALRLKKLKWSEIGRMCAELARKVRSYSPEVLVGISRGGLVPVRLLSDILDNRDVAIMKIEFYKAMGKTSGFPKITQPLNVDVKGKRVLIVDDVADTGRSLLVAKDHVERAGAKEVKIATLHFKPASVFRPDFYISETSEWLVYPWEKRETERELRAAKGKKHS